MMAFSSCILSIFPLLLGLARSQYVPSIGTIVEEYVADSITTDVNRIHRAVLFYPPDGYSMFIAFTGDCNFACGINPEDIPVRSEVTGDFIIDGIFMVTMMDQGDGSSDHDPGVAVVATGKFFTTWVSLAGLVYYTGKMEGQFGGVTQYSTLTLKVPQGGRNSPTFYELGSYRPIALSEDAELLSKQFGVGERHICLFLPDDLDVAAGVFCIGANDHTQLLTPTDVGYMPGSEGCMEMSDLSVEGAEGLAVSGDVSCLVYSQGAICGGPIKQCVDVSLYNAFLGREMQCMPDNTDPQSYTRDFSVDCPMGDSSVDWSYCRDVPGYVSTDDNGMTDDGEYGHLTPMAAEPSNTESDEPLGEDDGETLQTTPVPTFQPTVVRAVTSLLPGHVPSGVESGMVSKTSPEPVDPNGSDQDDDEDDKNDSFNVILYAVIGTGALLAFLIGACVIVILVKHNSRSRAVMSKQNTAPTHALAAQYNQRGNHSSSRNSHSASRRSNSHMRRGGGSRRTSIQYRRSVAMNTVSSHSQSSDRRSHGNEYGVVELDPGLSVQAGEYNSSYLQPEVRYDTANSALVEPANLYEPTDAALGVAAGSATSEYGFTSSQPEHHYDGAEEPLGGLGMTTYTTNEYGSTPIVEQSQVYDGTDTPI